jgi:translocator assembly and maintenance protein 41
MNEGALVDSVRQAFPPLAVCIAYGSGVIAQAGYSVGQINYRLLLVLTLAAGCTQEKARPMIDMVFGVHDTRAWHAANLSRNPSHYSFVGTMGGASAVCWVQRTSAPRIYYNTLVPFNGQVPFLFSLSLSFVSIN